MSYTVLARRYRSREFDELVGQCAIADTLKRAVEQDRVAHAYLFCGTRGVGKTSLARILARAINAVDALADCQAVGEAIMRGDDLDVIEIDGASNRGVDQARELIASAGLSPARCPYRVYIIDEVHMLTSEAFNTLLKTMEEPPAHVKFILCTTEPHKVPATIRSRCQRFDFKPIASADIVKHLRHVISLEGVQAEDGVLERVATLGQGSMRDALSVLERLLAGGDASISLASVESTLGLPPTELVMHVVDAVVQGDVSAALQGADTLLQQGVALDQVVESLIDTFRSLMLLSACGPETELLDLSDAQRVDLARRAESGTSDVFAHAVAVMEAVARQAALAASARALFDAALVRLAMTGSIEDDASGGSMTDTPGAKKKAPLKRRVKVEAEAEAKAEVRPTPQAMPTVQVAAAKAVAQTPPVAKASTTKAAAATPASAAPASKQTIGPASAPSLGPDAASPEELVERWSTAIDAMPGAVLQAAAELLQPVALKDGVLLLNAGRDHSSALIERVAAMQPAAAAVFGKDVRLSLTEASMPGKRVQSAGAVGADSTTQDPLVQMVSEVFDAEVVQIRASKELKKNV